MLHGLSNQYSNLRHATAKDLVLQQTRIILLTLPLTLRDSHQEFTPISYMFKS